MKDERNDFPNVELKFSDEPTSEQIRKMVEKRNKLLRQMGYNIGPDGKVEKKQIIYFQLVSGIIIKICREKLTAYRLNKQTNEWQEDSVLFNEYEHGNLDGEEIDMEDNYPYGEEHHYGRHL